MQIPWNKDESQTFIADMDELSKDTLLQFIFVKEYSRIQSQSLYQVKFSTDWLMKHILVSFSINIE